MLRIVFRHKWLTAGLFAFLVAGCIGLGDGGGNGTPDGSGNDNITTPPPPDDVALRVMLVASNTTPTLGEEVFLRCMIVEGDASNPTYRFQPNTRRLIVDAMAGTASFIVEEVDLGTELLATCTVTTDAGTSEPSNRVSIFPT